MANASTLIDIAVSWSQQLPEKTAYTFLRDGEEPADCISYLDLNVKAQALAANLQKQLSPGDTVLLLFPSGIDFIVSFIACLYAGVIAVPVNNPKPKKLHWQRLAGIVDDAEISMILSTEENINKNSDWLKEDEGISQRNLQTIENFTGGNETANWEKPNTSLSDVAFLQYTSGSTGSPKGVMVTHGNLMHNSELIRTAFNHSENSIFVTWLPLFHDLGLIGNILQTLYLGATCFLMTPVAFLQRPVRWLQAISRFRANTSMAPNFAYELCISQISDEQKKLLDLSSWRLALNGAEPIRADTVIRFEEFFADCGFKKQSSFPAYGLAEGTLITSTSDYDGGMCCLSVDRKKFYDGVVQLADPVGNEFGSVLTLASSGKTRLSQSLAVVNPETRQLCANKEIGELWLHGGSVAAGYWKNEQASKEVFQGFIEGDLCGLPSGPYMRTGDLAFLCEDWLYITGRLKEVIIIRGQNFYPQDIERAAQLRNTDLRADCGAAFGIECDGEEKLVLVQEVERTAIRRLDGDAVCSAVRHEISEGFDLMIYAVVLIKPATLPKTSSGKIQRRRCRQLYHAGELAALYHDVLSDSTPTISGKHDFPGLDELREKGILPNTDEIRIWLLSRLSNFLGVMPEAIDHATPIADYGLDSSVAISISSDIADWIGNEQDPNLLWMYPSVDKLVDHMESEFKCGELEPQAYE